jgi:hypothetical protein
MLEREVITVDRIVAAQSILDRFRDATYLEIGVNTGVSFIPIRARRKWGVDPNYILTAKRRLKYAVFSSLGIKVERLFRMTSDEFFETKREMLLENGIDVCLVDGLHTYEQALRDVLNTLVNLKPNGVVLVHDCNPATELMALPAKSIEQLAKEDIAGWDGAWSGDVWKAVVHLRSLRDDLNVFVLDCDTGLGVVARGQPKRHTQYSEADIQAMDYKFLAGNRGELLGLQPPEYFDTFLREHFREQ